MSCFLRGALYQSIRVPFSVINLPSPPLCDTISAAPRYNVDCENTNYQLCIFMEKALLDQLLIVLYIRLYCCHVIKSRRTLFYSFREETSLGFISMTCNPVQENFRQYKSRSIAREYFLTPQIHGLPSAGLPRCPQEMSALARPRMCSRGVQTILIRRDCRLAR